MVDVAEARNWKSPRVSGHEDFRRMVWLEASVRGVKTIGYEPVPADLELLRREREARQVNRIEPDAPASPTTAGKASARGSSGRKTVLAAIEAVLVAQRVPEKRREAIMAAAGLGSVPGGGGEILVDRVRNRISPLKANTAQWMGVMDRAHALGLASSVTMMFGHVETLADRIEHLEVVRAQQDRSLARLPGVAVGAPDGSGDVPEPMRRAAAYAQALESGSLSGGAFTAFICWTFQPENTVLKAPTVGAHEYLKTQALSRIYLDNVPSVQSSWVTQGPEVGQVALKYGANDLGSIMIEENVVSAAGTTFRMGVADMRRLITELGYEPRQRDNWYRILPSGSAAPATAGQPVGAVA